MGFRQDLSASDLLVANKTEVGNCSACCFKNWNYACYKLVCEDKNGHTVYWTLSNREAKEVPFIWNEYFGKCFDIKALCRSKIAELYKQK